MEWNPFPTRGDNTLDILAITSGDYEVEAIYDNPSDHAMLVMKTQVQWDIELMERSVKKEGEPSKPDLRNNDYVSRYAKTKIAEATQDTKG